MIEQIKRFFNVSDKLLTIKIKELDLNLTNAKNRDINHLENVAIDIMGCDKETKHPLTILYIITHSALSADRVIDLNLMIDMNNPSTINTAMEMANKGATNKYIVNKILMGN